MAEPAVNGDGAQATVTELLTQNLFHGVNDDYTPKSDGIKARDFWDRFMAERQRVNRTDPQHIAAFSAKLRSQASDWWGQENRREPIVTIRQLQDAFFNAYLADADRATRQQNTDYGKQPAKLHDRLYIVHVFDHVRQVTAADTEEKIRLLSAQLEENLVSDKTFKFVTKSTCPDPDITEAEHQAAVNSIRNLLTNGSALTADNANNIPAVTAAKWRTVFLQFAEALTRVNAVHSSKHQIYLDSVSQISRNASKPYLRSLAQKWYQNLEGTEMDFMRAFEKEFASNQKATAAAGKPVTVAAVNEGEHQEQEQQQPEEVCAVNGGAKRGARSGRGRGRGRGGAGRGGGRGGGASGGSSSSDSSYPSDHKFKCSFCRNDAFKHTTDECRKLKALMDKQKKNTTGAETATSSITIARPLFPVSSVATDDWLSSGN